MRKRQNTVASQVVAMEEIAVRFEALAAAWELEDAQMGTTPFVHACEVRRVALLLLVHC